MTKTSSAESHVEGTRVGVRHVAGKVVNGEQSPAYVADQFDVALAAVYEALAYYDDNIGEIREYERENAEASKAVRESSLKPKEPVS